MSTHFPSLSPNTNRYLRYQKIVRPVFFTPWKSPLPEGGMSIWPPFNLHIGKAPEWTTRGRFRDFFHLHPPKEHDDLHVSPKTAEGEGSIFAPPPPASSQSSGPPASGTSANTVTFGTPWTLGESTKFWAPPDGRYVPPHITKTLNSLFKEFKVIIGKGKAPIMIAYNKDILCLFCYG